MNNIRTEMTYRTSTKGVYACGDARIGQSLVVTAIAEGRKCARIVNKDLGGTPMDADREMLALGAWSGDPDRTLRHEAEAAGTVRPGRSSSPGRAPVIAEPRLAGQREFHPRVAGDVKMDMRSPGGRVNETPKLGTGKLALVVRELRPHFPDSRGGQKDLAPPDPFPCRPFAATTA